VSMVAYPARNWVRIGDNHDGDCFVGAVWREDVELGAMDNGSGMVWDMFWGCRCIEVVGLIPRARMQKTYRVRRGSIIGIDAGGSEVHKIRREDSVFHLVRSEQTGPVVWISNNHHHQRNLGFGFGRRAERYSGPRTRSPPRRRPDIGGGVTMFGAVGVRLPFRLPSHSAGSPDKRGRRPFVDGATVADLVILVALLLS
jgi:hypothetical protein